MARRQLAPSGGTSGARRDRAVLAWTPVTSRGRPAHVFLTVKSRDHQFNTLLEVQSWNQFATALRECPSPIRGEEVKGRRGNVFDSTIAKSALATHQRP